LTEPGDLQPLGDTDANEADVQEQAEDVTEPESISPRRGSLEVDEFDAGEQGRPIDLDPDEYR
jgi:hypothetical protein